MTFDHNNLPDNFIKITLSIKNKLSSNQKNGNHWSKFSAAKAKAKEEGYYAAIAHKNAFNANSRLSIITIFYFKDKIHRDLSNFYEGLKNQIDGIFLALRCDDWQIDQSIQIRGPIDKLNPRVEVFIGPSLDC